MLMKDKLNWKCWEDCKTKKEKDDFIKELDEIEKKGKYYPINKLLKEFGYKKPKENGKKRRKKW